MTSRPWAAAAKEIPNARWCATIRSVFPFAVRAGGQGPASQGHLPPAGPATAAAVLECERPRWKPATVLTRLLRSFLRRYTRQIAIVVILLVAQTVGNLYLPGLR